VNPLDIGVIAVIALSAVFAFARGFVREALSIVAWVSAGAITLYGFDAVNAMIEPLVNNNRLLSQLITGFGLFIGSLIVLTIVTGFIARAVRGTALSAIDRTLGFTFGLLRGAFIVSLAYLLLDFTGVSANDRPIWIQEAKSKPYLQQGADFLKGVLPESLRNKATTAVDEGTRIVNPAVEAEKARRALSFPAAPPPTQAQPSPPANYKPGDQRELDRLIGGSQR